MPIIPSVIRELPEHIFRPIVQQLCDRILNTISCRERVKDNVYINTEWSTHSHTGTLEKDAILNQEGLRVDANLQLNPTSQKWDTYTFHHASAYMVGRPLLSDLIPIYEDHVNMVRISELRSPISIVLNCTLTLRSADVAFSTPQQLFGMHENGAVYHFQDLAFDYPIPKDILFILTTLWQMDRNDGLPAKVTFADYLKHRTGGTWQLHKHKAKNQFEIVIPSVNVDSLAVLEYSDDNPQGVMQDKLPVGFSIPFTYTAQMEMPTQFFIQYPAVYNNQLLPKSCVPVPTVKRLNSLPAEYMYIGLNGYNETLGAFDAQGCIHAPHYDDWIPNYNTHKVDHYVPFLILHLLVGEDIVLDPRTGDPIYEINISDLNDFKDDKIGISPAVKEILHRQGRYSVANDVICNVALFKDNRRLIGGSDFTFNDKLQLKFRPKNLHSHYRIVLSACNSLADINEFWYKTVKLFFPYLNTALKLQVRNRINEGNWHGTRYSSGDYRSLAGTPPLRDKFGRLMYPPLASVTKEGDIYDSHTNKFIENIRDSVYPIVVCGNLPNTVIPKPTDPELAEDEDYINDKGGINTLPEYFDPVTGEEINKGEGDGGSVGGDNGEGSTGNVPDNPDSPNHKPIDPSKPGSGGSTSGSGNIIGGNESTIHGIYKHTRVFNTTIIAHDPEGTKTRASR